MKKNTLASENIRLNEELLKMKAELASLKKDKKSLSRKLDTANRKKSELQKNSKKKVANTIELSEEQDLLLSTLLKGINILK